MRSVWISFALGLIASLILLFAPLGTKGEAVRIGSAERGTVTHESLVEHEGWWVAGLVAIPVAVGAVPLVVRRRFALSARIASATLLGAFVVLGIFSVGLFFLPAWVAMVVAAASSGREPT